MHRAGKIIGGNSSGKIYFHSPIYDEVFAFISLDGNCPSLLGNWLIYCIVPKTCAQ